MFGNNKLKQLEKENQELRGKIARLKVLEEMLDSEIDYSDTDNQGKPPHYLSDLNEAERKHFVAHLSHIYRDDKLQKVINYVINLIGNQSMHVVSEENMKNGRYAIIGIRTLTKELNKAHNEATKPREEELDPQELL